MHDPDLTHAEPADYDTPQTFSAIADELAAELKESEAITARIAGLTAEREKHETAAEGLAERLRPMIIRNPDKTLRVLVGHSHEPYLLELWIDGNEAIDYRRVELLRPWALDRRFQAAVKAEPNETALDRYRDLPGEIVPDEPPLDRPAHLHSNLCDGGCERIAGEPAANRADIHHGADAAEYGRRADAEIAASF